jgi:hypothetical protein
MSDGDVKTRVNLVASFADNASGNITAQDIRDFLASVPLSTELPAAGIASVVADTTPQLGGDLDVNGHSIKGVIYTSQNDGFTYSPSVTLATDNAQVPGSIILAPGVSNGCTDGVIQLGGDIDLNGYSITGLVSGIASVVADTSPQLGGDLDTNGSDIKSAAATDTDNITISTGDSTSGDAGTTGDLTLTTGGGMDYCFAGDVIIGPGMAGLPGGSGGSGSLIVQNIPTSDPSIEGALWDNLGILTISHPQV